jgi:hypothetical protein
MPGKLESMFQRCTKEEIKEMLPGCIWKRNSTDDIQGFPDVSVYCNGLTAFLEFKRCKTAPHRPNQDYYVNYINSTGGFARFIYPENAEEIKKELKQYFNQMYQGPLDE